MPESSPVELSVYAVFTLLALREIFRFLQAVLSQRSAELTGVRKEMTEELGKIRAQISEMTEESHEVLTKLTVAQDREQRFWDRDWPTLVNDVAEITRRVAVNESNLAQVQTRLDIKPKKQPPTIPTIVMDE